MEYQSGRIANRRKSCKTLLPTLLLLLLLEMLLLLKQMDEPHPFHCVLVSQEEISTRHENTQQNFPWPSPATFLPVLFSFFPSAGQRIASFVASPPNCEDVLFLSSCLSIQFLKQPFSSNVFILCCCPVMGRLKAKGFLPSWFF